MRIRRRLVGVLAVAVVGAASVTGGLFVYDSMRSDLNEVAERPGQGEANKPANERTPGGETSPVSNTSTWARLEGNPSLAADLLTSCSDPKQEECVAGFMRDHGAKEGAVEFYRRAKAFLIRFKESGTVDVGVMLDPWLANNNTRTLLLNGEPPIFEPHESEPPSGIRLDAEFLLAKEVFPNLDLGIQFPFLESVRRSDERSRYIFQFYLENGCHACDTGFRARVIFRFDGDGKHEGSGFLGICNSNDNLGTPAELSHIPVCPPPPSGLYPGFAGGPR